VNHAEEQETMKVIEPSFKIESPVDGMAMLKRIERYARTCYKSEARITDTSCLEFVGRLLHTNKHKNIVEHESVTVRIICDRGVSHELVTHRIASRLQESTRYCDYKGEMEFIRPLWAHPETKEYALWANTMMLIEDRYRQLRAWGWKPEQARSVLPNSLKTEIVLTLNFSSWRNFFQLRVAPNAHPQMRQITRPLLAEFKRLIPVVFDDIEVAE
jgi:thymidylate synthase (FAD)